MAEKERERERDLLCKKSGAEAPVSLHFLSSLLIFDYRPLMRWTFLG